jgi:hypothetical protein
MNESDVLAYGSRPSGGARGAGVRKKVATQLTGANAGRFPNRRTARTAAGAPARAPGPGAVTRVAAAKRTANVTNAAPAPGRAVKKNARTPTEPRGVPNIPRRRNVPGATEAAPPKKAKKGGTAKIPRRRA